MTEQWKTEPYDGADKQIVIYGPGTLLVYVDYDDVDHDEVDAMMPKIVEALNGIRS